MKGKEKKNYKNKSTNKYTSDRNNLSNYNNKYSFTKIDLNMDKTNFYKKDNYGNSLINNKKKNNKTYKETNYYKNYLYDNNTYNSNEVNYSQFGNIQNND